MNCELWLRGAVWTGWAVGGWRFLWAEGSGMGPATVAQGLGGCAFYRLGQGRRRLRVDGNVSSTGGTWNVVVNLTAASGV